jgi:hypothetical protein
MLRQIVGLTLPCGKCVPYLPINECVCLIDSLRDLEQFDAEGQESLALDLLSIVVYSRKKRGTRTSMEVMDAYFDGSDGRTLSFYF